MNEVWYKKLGFYSNPFNIKPAAFHEELVAYDLSSIYKKIEKGDMLFIEGEYGSGKTTILKNIIARFKGRNRIVYYSFNTGEQVFDVRKLLDGANSLLRQITGFKEKNIVLLLDEVHSMKPGDAKKLLKPYKDGVIKSVVFVSHNYDLTEFPEEVSALLNGNVLRTTSLTPAEAIILVRKRIGTLDIIPDKIISKIYLRAGKNPRRILEHCEDVVRFAVEIGDTQVTDYHVTEVLGKEPKKPAPKNGQIKATKEAKPAKIKPVEVPLEIEVKSESIQRNVAEARPEKKFKINKLVSEEKKHMLGTIAEKEPQTDEEAPEYKVYFIDN
jgi:ABC-type ATPase with predicted acetyltransferase domain